MRNFSEITDDIRDLAKECVKSSEIDHDLYPRLGVKRGLRDLDGNGVLAGLTKISEVRAKKTVGSEAVPCHGELFYRGVNVRDIVRGCIDEKRSGFEEAVYLLLFGKLPSGDRLASFRSLLGSYRTLPPSFVRDVLMKAPSVDMMNTLSRSVLTLYSYDENADDISIENVLRQCIALIAQMPTLAAQGYAVYSYAHTGSSLYIHAPDASLSTAENILMMMRPDKKFTPLEAHVLDIALILHAEHGGGNNSSFTTRVVSSSGTDTYSAVAAALGSLKGPKHGGANIKVVKMFEDMKASVSDWADEDALRGYLKKLLDKEAFDRSGLIYGVGHAVYSLSDPRAEIFRKYVSALAGANGRGDEFALYERVERLAPEVIASQRKIYKGVSSNVDFYSGFAYQLLGLPMELYTPIFAVARMAGWSAHRLEELVSAGKIIRPAYKWVGEETPYVNLKDR